MQAYAQPSETQRLAWTMVPVAAVLRLVPASHKGFPVLHGPTAPLPPSGTKPQCWDVVGESHGE